jgi:flagellar biosynthesis protein FlhB
MPKEGVGGEKTEKATPTRIKKARKDGQIPRTQELGTWLGIAVASVMVPRTVSSAMERSQALMIKSSAAITDPSMEAVRRMFMDALLIFLMVVLPLAIVMLVIGSVSAAAQGGVRWSNKPLTPSLKKFNPVPGIKRMFGPQGAWEATKALIKTIALGTTLLMTSDTAQALVMSSGSLPLSAITDTVAESAVTMFRVAAFTGLALAVVDYIIVRKRMMKQIKMSKYEITQEYKQSEGDPLIKAQRRAAALAMSGNRMIAAVSDADVMLVNPTHVAVALKYDIANGAPKVVAKGAGETATRLREEATTQRIPMVQDIALTRALYASCELGQSVPPQLFTAVARVLAFVMQLKSKGVAAGMHRPGFPAPEVEGLPKARRGR